MFVAVADVAFRCVMSCVSITFCCREHPFGKMPNSEGELWPDEKPKQATSRLLSLEAD